MISLAGHPDDDDHDHDPTQSPAYRHQPTDYALTYLPRLLSRMTPANRATARRYLSFKTGQGVKPTSLVSVGQALLHMDELSGGRPFGELTPDNASAILAAYGEDHSPTSVNLLSKNMKALFTYLHGGVLPPAYKLALKRSKAVAFATRDPLSEEDFERMLAACDGVVGESPRRAAFWRAMLWTLWDGGLRVGEALALRVGSLTFNEDGTTRIRLPDERYGLKTGPRTIYVHGATPALRAWVAFLPWNDNPDGLLFPSFRGDGPLPLKATGMGVRELARRAGLTRNVHPHLFRHTCATRKARHGWKESKLREHFGWGPTSTMPYHYVHLAETDLQEQVRRDAEARSLVNVRAPDSQADLAAALKDLAAALKKPEAG